MSFSVSILVLLLPLSPLVVAERSPCPDTQRPKQTLTARPCFCFPVSIQWVPRSNPDNRSRMPNVVVSSILSSGQRCSRTVKESPG
ncbi:MAG: hypothetical protein J3Q66DRAFT_361283 [Benniella sp.]|nr:MAG: hypothetical protein J3Q66DRAFT_361283 [Benniella sp.]